MEYLDKIIETFELPDGYHWEYYYQKSSSNPYQGWDNLRVVDSSGQKVEESIIHGVRDYYQWCRSAEKVLKDINTKLEDAKFRREMMNPTYTIEDLGESNPAPVTDLKSLTGKPKKKAWWNF